jgi:hypothetical protein
MTTILISLGLCCLALIALVYSFSLLGEGDYRPSRRQLRQWRRQRLVIKRGGNWRR